MNDIVQIKKRKSFLLSNVFFFLLIFTAVSLGMIAGAAFGSPTSLRTYITDPASESPAEAYTIGGTAVTTESGFAALRNTSTTAYLANDITLTNSIWEDSTVKGTTPYSGTLYGNGKTITITMSANLRDLSDKNPQYIGLMFGYLSGTVRDCTIRLTGNISYYEYTGSGSNFSTSLGIICGILQGGTVTNVNVIVDGYLNAIGRDTGSSTSKGGTGALVGAIAGTASGGTISNCKVINNNAIYGATEDDHGNDDEGSSTRVCVGGFVGEAGSGTLTMTNIALNGAAGSVIGSQINYNVSGNPHNSARAGGIIGAVRGGATVNITNLDYKFKGYIATCASNPGYANFLIGRTWPNSTTTISNVKFSNYVFPKILKSKKSLARQSYINPTSFNNNLAFNGVWPYTSGYSSNVFLEADFDSASLSARMYTTGGTVNKSNFYFDDGAVDYIIYNNTSETASYAVLAYDGNYNNSHTASTLWNNFHGASGSYVYSWNSSGFNVRMECGLGEALPLNMFDNELALLGNGLGKTLYLTGNAKSTGMLLFHLYDGWSAPNVVFNINASCAKYPIYDQTTVSGGNITIAGGNLSGNWAEAGTGVVHMTGVTPLNVAGGTISNTGGGEAIFCNSSVVTISGGTLSAASGYGIFVNGGGTCTISGGTVNSASFSVYIPNNGTLSLSGGTLNGTYSVVCTTAMNAFNLSGAPALNGTTMDLYTGKAIAATNVTGTYTLQWTGSTANGTTIAAGCSDPARFQLANSGYALYPSGNNLKIGKVSSISYYGVSSATNLLTSYIESYGATLTVPTSANIAAGFTYAGMYTSQSFSTSISSVSSSVTGTVNIFVKKTLVYSMSSTATSAIYGDATITLGVTASVNASCLTYVWTKGGTAYSSAATVTLSQVSDSDTYAVTATYTETIGGYTLLSTGAASSKSITIQPRTLTISGVDAVNRIYNKTTVVALTGGTLVNYKDGDGSSGNALLGFCLGTATIPSANQGTYTVSGIQISLTGSKSSNYTLIQPAGIDVIISPKSLASDIVFGTTEAQTFTGLAITPEPSVADSLQTLAKGTDFAYSYQNNINIGTAVITVTGIGNYTGTNSTTFAIHAKNIASGGIAIASIADFVYSGSANTPSPAVINTISSATLAKGTETSGDYWLTYANNINAGTATLTVNGRGNYCGTLSTYFTIGKADVTLTLVGLSSITYGQTLSSSVINGTAKNTQFSTVNVPGTWSFVSPSTKPSAGTCSCPVQFTPASTGNYNIPGTVTGNLNINKCVPTLSDLSSTPIEYKKTLSESSVSGTATNSYDSTFVPGSFAYTDGTQIAYAGVSYEVTFLPQNTDNYTIATAMLMVNIEKRLIAITYLDAIDRAYNATTVINDFVWILSGTEPDEEVGLFATGSIVSPAASSSAYNVDIVSLELTGTHKDNYRVESYAGNISVFITPLTLEINSAGLSKHYGETDPVLEEQIDSRTSDGLLTVIYTRIVSGETQNAGKYSFTSVSLKTPNPNYNVVFAADGAKDKFVIHPFCLSVTAAFYSKTYGEEDPAFTQSFDGAYGEVIEVIYTRESFSQNAGAYSFSTVSLAVENSNYEVSFADGGNIGRFIIHPYLLEVTARQFSKTYSEEDPVFIQDFNGANSEVKTVIFSRDTLTPRRTERRNIQLHRSCLRGIRSQL
jgi:hypothetical protein